MRQKSLSSATFLGEVCRLSEMGLCVSAVKELMWPAEDRWRALFDIPFKPHFEWNKLRSQATATPTAANKALS